MCFSGDAASFCSSYNVSGTDTIWTKAREKCRHSGAYLVAMESEEEWKFLKSKLNDSQFQNGVRWHIGLKNESDKWCWTTRGNSCIEVKVGSSRWNDLEPNKRNTESCVEMLQSGV